LNRNGLKQALADPALVMSTGLNSSAMEFQLFADDIPCQALTTVEVVEPAG
jgi:hypothetical protein